MARSHPTEWYWIVAGVLAGFAAWVAVGAAGFALLRTTWPSYVVAEPAKSYTLSMLFARLAVGVVCTIAAGALAAVAAKRSWVASVWLGLALLLISAPVHFGRVWADYPPWYHFAYLLPLVPLTILGGLLTTVGVATVSLDRSQAVVR